MANVTDPWKKWSWLSDDGSFRTPTRSYHRTNCWNPGYTDVATAMWPACNQKEKKKKKNSRRGLSKIAKKSQQGREEVAEWPQIKFNRRSFGHSQKTRCDWFSRTEPISRLATSCRSVTDHLGLLLRHCYDQSAIFRADQSAIVCRFSVYKKVCPCIN